MSLLKSLTDIVLNAGGQKAGLLESVMQNPKLMEGVMGLLSKDSPVGGCKGYCPISRMRAWQRKRSKKAWLGDGATSPVGWGDIRNRRWVVTWCGNWQNRPIWPRPRPLMCCRRLCPL